MRAFIVLILLVAGISGTKANEQEQAQRVANAIHEYMTATYACQHVLGGLGHYQAARTIAIGTIQQTIDNNQAILLVERLDQRIRDDAENYTLPTGGPEGEACRELTSEALFELTAAKAAAGLH